MTTPCFRFDDDIASLPVDPAPVELGNSHGSSVTNRPDMQPSMPEALVLCLEDTLFFSREIPYFCFAMPLRLTIQATELEFAIYF
jgi:hypothetical protein